MLFPRRLQTEDSVQQLEERYRAAISALRSKLDSRAAPPILHLDTTYLQTPSLNTPTFNPSLSETLGHAGSSSLQESWSFLKTWMRENLKLRTQDGIFSEDGQQKESSPAVTWSFLSEDLTFVKLMSSALPLPVQSTTTVHAVTEDEHTETTAEPRPAAHSVKSLSLHRKHRSLLRKRQIPVANGKSMWHIQILPVVTFGNDCSKGLSIVVLPFKVVFLIFCSLSGSERVHTGSRPSQRFLRLGLKDPKQEPAHELPRGKSSFEEGRLRSFCEF